MLIEKINDGETGDAREREQDGGMGNILCHASREFESLAFFNSEENRTTISSWLNIDACSRYFWKPASQPSKFESLYKEVQALIGRPCPFKMAQVLKFPGHSLSKLETKNAKGLV